MLLQQGVSAKLIQSNDGFNLSNLYELRYFSDIIYLNADSPLITDEDWDHAKHRLNTHKAFLFESKVEDFVSIDAEVVYVSTIHKAKGKEFDNVCLLLNNFVPGTDEHKRQFYVAITRPKSNLAIHYNGNYLQPFSIDGLVFDKDRVAAARVNFIVYWNDEANGGEIQNNIAELAAQKGISIVFRVGACPRVRAVAPASCASKGFLYYFDTKLKIGLFAAA